MTQSVQPGESPADARAAFDTELRAPLPGQRRLEPTAKEIEDEMALFRASTGA